MSRENLFSGSTISAPSNYSLHVDNDDVQHRHQVDDASHQMHVENEIQSNFTDLKKVSQNSDEDIARKQISSRWDDCLKKSVDIQTHTQQPSQTKIILPPLDKLVVREFLPRTVCDPILPILRELFVRSFDQFYKEIEAQLKLKTNKTLVEWLQETFDEMQEEIFTKKCRCFMLCSLDPVKNDTKHDVIGFLTLKEEENGSVYIAQCAVEARSKRHGYGARLLQHLRDIYPPGTFYWGLCRRANIPAVKFYLKQGAKFMDNEEVGTKYGYDPTLYTGFQFTDNTGNVQSSKAHSSTVSSIASTAPSRCESSLKPRSHVTCQDNSTMTDSLLDLQKPEKSKKSRKNQCCVVS